MMRNFGEYPNEERESHLSWILEENPLPKYYLSARACQGILSRAERKGKELPQRLKNALIRQAGFTPTQEDNVALNMKKALVLLSKLAGGGTAVFCLNDQGGKVMSITEDKTSTLRAESHQHEPIVLSFQERSGEGVLIQEDHTGALRRTFHCQSVLDDRSPICIQGGK